MAGGRHFEKLLNRYNCSAVPSTFTKLRILFVSTLSTVKKFRIFKIQDGGRPHFAKPP